MVSQFLSESTLPLTQNMTVKEAKKELVHNRLTFLPLIINQQLVNYIGYSQLEQANDNEMIADLPLFSPILPVINSSQHILDAIKQLKSLDLPLLVVTDDNHEYLGIIKTTELVKILSLSYSIGSAGSIIVLQVKPQDYSISDLARIIEYNDAKVLGVFTFETSNNELIEIHIKLNTTVLANILSTLERYDYKVLSYYNREDLMFDNDLRYKSLMNYLDL